MRRIGKKRRFNEEHWNQTDFQIPPLIGNAELEHQTAVMNLVANYFDHDKRPCTLKWIVEVTQDNGFPEMTAEKVEAACLSLASKGRIIFDREESIILQMK